MDKYTVDLDKVLNDFEYSELTEHNTNSVPSSSYAADVTNPYLYSHVTQPRAYYEGTYEPHHTKNSTVKHSINNVFHSLNEYLNTEVKTELDKPATNFANITEIETNVPFVRKNSDSLPSIEDVFKNVAKDTFVFKSNVLKTDENFIDNLNSNENIIDNLNTNEKFIDNLNTNENFIDNLNTNENFIDNTNDASSSDNVKNTNAYANLSGDDKNDVNITQIVNGVENVFETVDTSTDDITNLIDTDVAAPAPTNVTHDSITTITTECYIESDVIGLNNEDDVKGVQANVFETDNMEVPPKEVDPPKSAPAVGFDEVSEISDSELENELAQLEKEYKERVDTTESDIAPEVESNLNGETESETVISVNETEPNSISEVETICDNINVTSDIKVDTVEDNINNENGEKVDDKLESQSGERRPSLMRPNSLDIASEGTSISLIGAPGSTPFNNVYIQNAISTDPSNSLSPTTSEVSTSENSDSGATDSCNDTSLDVEPPHTGAEPLREEPEGTEVSDISQRYGDVKEYLGKTAPFWTPDSEAVACLHCNTKFTLMKRRHHCRACGLVLCSKCCHMKWKLEYMENMEARVCMKCYDILSRESSSSSDASPEAQPSSPKPQPRLHPNNPMDYCSVVPPLEQVSNVPVSPPAVMVPVGVLKRKGSGKNRSGKSVMFCDGIRPGCDLTELDYDFNYKAKMHAGGRKTVNAGAIKVNRNVPQLDASTNSFIPSADAGLPPTVTVVKTDISYSECENEPNLVETLRNETVTFAIQRNLHIHVRIINMDCCINKYAWCFSTEGLIAVGQDEIVILLELMDNEDLVPKDIFLHLNNIYGDAVKGTSITEMGLSIHNTSNFLGSKNHAGFLYIRSTFQCVQNVIIPKEPYLIGILIHRWESPWAKIFPLRLLLRLGAEYRYYPSPIISTRHRDSVYVEIGHTIINLLADFRNFSYTLPYVRGLTIHMEEKNTTVSIPGNRYNQVMKALNNSSDHILAFAANFSPKADSHLVCIQDTHGANENTYTTHAINIHNKPRKVTGASFIVLNGALKSSSGLTAKSSIVEDGLMIQILPEQMIKLRTSLRNMKDFRINCGCVNVQSDEFVNIVWTENDVSFNVGVTSPIDNMSLNGVPSIRVHSGKDYVCNSGNKLIRWTEVFIIQSGEENNKTQDPVDISKLSESISKATSQALVKYLDLLATNNFLKIGIRTTLHIDSVSYLAGSNATKLPPIYMKSLDNELIPVLHKITTGNLGEGAIVLELIFHILNV